MNALVKVLVVMGISFAVSAAEARDDYFAQGEDIVVVRVKGMGVDHDAAVKDALRKALERGGHLEIFAQSESENYTLVRDTVLAQATGLVKDYRILSEGEDPIGGYFVEIEAKIDRKVIDATWGQVQILLKQMGRPKILVHIMEKVNDIALKTPDDRPEQVSLLENKIERLLVEKGFDVVDKIQVERIKQDKLKQADIDKDPQAMKQLAGEVGAQMYIVGFARASGPEITDAYGVRLFMWETDVTLKAFWSETGQILFNRSENGTRGGSRAPGPPGAKEALAKAGDKMAQECLQAILEKWSRQTVGGGKLILEVKGLDFRRLLILQDGLKQIEGVRDVNREWHKPVAKFEIGTVHSAEQFAEILSQVQFDGFALEVEDQKFNTLQASVVDIEQPPVDKQPSMNTTPAPEATTPAVPAPRKHNHKAEPSEKKVEPLPTLTPAPTEKVAKVPATVPTTKPVVKMVTKPTTNPTNKPVSTKPTSTKPVSTKPVDKTTTKPANQPVSQPMTKPASTQPTTKPVVEM